MKFISKASNYRIILRHGQPAEPLTGRTAVPGIYIKFEDGLAAIPDNGMGGLSKDEIFEMLKKHDAFGKDFHLIEDTARDPYAATRKPKEPEHTILELDRGAVSGAINAKRKPQIDPKQREALMDIAKEMALQMAPKLAEDLLRKMVAEKQEEKVSATPEEDTTEGDITGVVTESENIEASSIVAETIVAETITPGETPSVDAPKKKGRPRKVTTETNLA